MAAPNAGWIMLSDHEQRALRELEGQLTADDPKFARSFDTHAPSTGHSFLKTLAVIGIVAAIVLVAFILLVTGATALVFGLAVVTGLIWVSWRSIRNRDTSGS